VTGMPDDEVAALYAGPTSDFTVARDALAKKLKADGDKEAAAEVKALKRPTKLAWAIGRAASDEESAFENLIATAEALAAGGVDPRPAMKKLRDAVAVLADKAAALGDVDAGDATTGLLAITGDAGALEQLREGRLADVPAGGAFSMGPGAPVVEREAVEVEPGPDPEEIARLEAGVDDARKARAEAQRQLDEADDKLAAAKEALRAAKG
jgi:hypothetical protein